MEIRVDAEELRDLRLIVNYGKKQAVIELNDFLRKHLENKQAQSRRFDQATKPLTEELKASANNN